MGRRALILDVFVSILLTISFSSIAGHDTVNWWVLNTEHYQIVYHDGLEAEAQEFANHIEDTYQFWDETISVDYHGELFFPLSLVESHPDSYPFISYGQGNGIDYAVTSGGRTTNEWLNAKNPSPKNMVLAHEFGHVMDLTNVHGITEQVKSIVGDSFFTVLAKPRLMLEGLVIYGEELRTGHSRANDPRERMLMRQMALEEQVITFAEMVYDYDRQEWPPRYMVTHNFGPWVTRYLVEKHGIEVLQEIEDKAVSHPFNIFNNAISIFSLPVPPIGPDFSSILKDTIGMDGDEFHKDFTLWAQNYFRDQVGEVFLAGVTQTQKISPLGIWNYRPTWSPTNEWIAYVHNDFARGIQIRLIRPDGSEDHVVVEVNPAQTFGVPLTGSPTPSWAPDGGGLIIDIPDRFVRVHESNLYYYDLETEELNKLTQGIQAFEPLFSPDGEAIIFAQPAEKGSSPNLYRFEISSGKVELFYEIPNHMWLGRMAMAPDGQHIAMSVWHWGGFQDIYLLPMDGGEPVVVTRNLASDYDPAWTPDSEYVIFSSDFGDINNLFAHRLSDGSFYRVTNMLSGAFAPTVSPDQSHIAFAGYSTEGYEIHTMPFDPSSWVPVEIPQFSLPEKPELKRIYDVEPFPIRSLRGYQSTPRITPSRIGLSMNGSDQLGEQAYTASAGFNFEQMEPDITFDYSTGLLIPGVPVNFTFSSSPFGSSQSLSLTYPLFNSLKWAHQVSLNFYRSNSQIGEELSINPRWRGQYFTGWDLLKHRIGWTLRGSLNFDPATETRTHRAELDLEHDIRLPIEETQALTFNLAAGWSDSERPAFRALFGRYAVTGHRASMVSGAQALKLGVQYHLPLWTFNDTPFGSYPIFVQGIKGKVFAQSGIFGKDLQIENVLSGIGVEAALDISWPYLLQFSFKFGLSYGIGTDAPQFNFSFGFPESVF